MSADLLRHAAKEMREDGERYNSAAPTSGDYLLAIADLLDLMADVPCECNLAPTDSHCEHSAAEAAARAYLGEAS